MKRNALTILAAGLLFGTAGARADTVDFDKQIRPVLAQTCYKCHAGTKHKGDLKLASAADILKGGKDGPVVTPKDPGKSDLYHRITLSKDDDDRMPPKGEMLSKEQTDLVKQWIVEGKSFGTWKVDSPEEIAKATGGGGSEEACDPGHQRSGSANCSSGRPGRHRQNSADRRTCMKLAQNTNLLDVEFQLNGPNITDSQVAMLTPLAPQVIWLNLANTKVTDSGWLRWSSSRCSPPASGKDAGERRRPCSSQRADESGIPESLWHERDRPGLAQLADLKNLKELYLWQSKVTDAGAQNLRKQMPTLMVNIGWQEAASAAPGTPDQKPK